MNVFYLKDAIEGLNTLPEEESKHCVKVLRMTEGETFCVTDGEGFLYDAELVEGNTGREALSVTELAPVVPSGSCRRSWMTPFCTSEPPLSEAQSASNLGS